jgi:predicted permease
MADKSKSHRIIGRIIWWILFPLVVVAMVIAFNQPGFVVSWWYAPMIAVAGAAILIFARWLQRQKPRKK